MQDSYTMFKREAAARLFPPFCEETENRLKRLRVLQKNGDIDSEGVKSLAVVLGTALYDGLLENGEDVLEIHENLSELFDEEEFSGMYLYLCTLYGSTGEDVPVQIMWMAAHKPALIEFMAATLDAQCEWLIEDEIMPEEDEEGFADNVIPLAPESDTADDDTRA